MAMAVMSGLAINYFLAGRWYLADVGNIHYCLVNTWNGRFMWSPLAVVNHFGLHFTPFFFLLMPLVWLSPYPIPLVLSYQAALALTPVPLYLLGRRWGLPPVAAVALGFWFVCNHFLGSLQLANHFESFYVLFALATMAAIYSQSRHGWWIFAVLALSVKEDAAVWLLGFALWAWWLEKDEQVRRRGRLLAAACVAWGILAGLVMIVSARGQVQNAGSYFERMAGFSVGADNAWVFCLLVLSCGGLCLLNWRAALLLLIPLPVLLGNFTITRTLAYYYSYPFLPFMGFATVAGAATVWGWWTRRGAADGASVRSGALILAGALVVLGAAQYPLPTRTDGFRRLPIPVTPRDDMRRHVAADILPRDVPLALQFGLWGITPWRQDAVFLRDSQLRDHHYVFLDFYGVHGLSPEDNRQVMLRLRDEVDSGRRRELFNAYDLLVLAPVQDNETSENGNGGTADAR